MTRETHRFEWTEAQTPIETSARLVFRTLNEAGEKTFINTIMLVAQKTLDRLMRQEQEQLGLEQYAAMKFKELGATR